MTTIEANSPVTRIFSGGEVIVRVPKLDFQGLHALYLWTCQTLRPSCAPGTQISFVFAEESHTIDSLEEPCSPKEGARRIANTKALRMEMLKNTEERLAAWNREEP